MANHTEIIDKLAKALTKLPGIGPKSAERVIFHILKSDAAYAETLSQAILNVKQQIFFCDICFNLAAEKICSVCSNPGRNQSIICIVEEPRDVMAFEKAGGYNGVYHVLLGAISPLDGIGPSNLKVVELMKRVKEGSIQEIIFATNPSAEGEATATYLAQILADYPIKLSRIARGVPIGSSLDYLDQATLACALEERKEIMRTS